ncbi:MAG: cell division protein FtsZ [Pseudomonadales bacterium]|nr:cell division protein FtsZ [Pseudomonadales bacterium]
MFELIDSQPQKAVIKVVGVGGGGGNAVKHMIDKQVQGVEFICANTDAQALEDIETRTVLQLGTNITKGLGAGANPEVGRQAAMEDRDRIAEVLSGADMVFITAGMGGGTGTGAAPVVAEVAKELGILTVAVITKPFRFEGKKRMRLAEEGMRELAQHVDSLITIPNEKLMAVLGGKVSLVEAFSEANDVLHGAVQGIADLIMRPGMINVDFADVRTVMSEMGMAMMGTGRARGEDRAEEAARLAVSSPLLEDINLEGARGILVNITASESLELGEFADVGDIVEEFASDNATVVVGTVIDPSLDDEIKVTVVATGIGAEEMGMLASPPASSVRPQSSVERSYDNSIPTATPTSEHAAELVTPAVDYSAYDKPTAMRNPTNRLSSLPGGAAASQVKDDDLELLDIPAFLRRQAD